MGRLAKDSIAARKAGVSYGVWKASHPHTEYDEEASDTRRRCKICGKPLNSLKRMYCSQACGNKADYMRRKEEKVMKNGKA